MGVERPVAAIQYAAAPRAQGVVVQWGRVVDSGILVVGLVLWVVVVGPLVVVALVVVGMVLRVWPQDPSCIFRSPCWGSRVGHRV